MRHRMFATGACAAAICLIGVAPASAAPQASLPMDGYYIVNVDIYPGIYNTVSRDGCYWERLSGTSGDFDEIIANDFVSDPARLQVTIKPTDYAFHTEDCGNWIMQPPPAGGMPSTGSFGS